MPLACAILTGPEKAEVAHDLRTQCHATFTVATK